MSDLTINGNVVVKSDELTEVEEVDTSEAELLNKLGTAQTQLTQLLRRAEIDPAKLAKTGDLNGEPRQDDLKGLASALWLRAYYTELAKTFSDDEGFAGKFRRWDEETNRQMLLVLGLSFDPETGRLRRVAEALVTTEAGAPAADDDRDSLRMLEVTI